ncbi:hypothetical protein [Marinicrinis sediminis]|uniref:EamA domain-containing protein n=1 Tax=Marinicrinis sediminis TaxID=1652465 RepID=A0ABW5RDI4_9BACL
MIWLYGMTCLVIGLSVINGIFSFQSKYIDPDFWLTLRFQLKMIPLFFLSNVLIGFGIKWIFKASGQLTFTLTLTKGIEIGMILIMGYLFMKEIPTWKTFAGLFLIISGFVLTRIK